ncbi:MAG: PhoX family phosphatase [Bryobacter sp.]|nr:PhoX family phosphatase [Bryobacter sp.]
MLKNLEKLMPWLGDSEGDEPINPSSNPSFGEIVGKRYGRRDILKGLAAAAMVASATGTVSAATNPEMRLPNPGLNFKPIPMGNNDFINIPDNYGASLVAGWGDPVLPGAPAFDPKNQTAAAQEQQFGYNCDFVGYFPLPGPTSVNSNLGLLAVNHEYTNPELMFENYQAGNPTKEQVDIEIAAHGVTVVEIQRMPNAWEYIQYSRYNRRFTGSSAMELTGPAAGDDLLKTSADPTGRRVAGTLNNCAGGKTPWGTLLTAEENFNQYFGNVNGLPAGVVKTAHTRYGLTNGASPRLWERFHDRFDVVKEPNEGFRHGWVVEIDPYDPTWVPKKRTALGRFKHEAATFMEARDGRVAFYTGDDERFEYVYKFVTNKAWDKTNRAANRDLLDDGVLYVARFDANGTGEWLPLVYGQGPLTMANGFRSQADVLIRARFAADALGATKMDRPEDIEANPLTNKVYLVCTNNTNRQAAQTDKVNPRPANRHGHIIEIIEGNGGDAAAMQFRWEMFMLCGDPKNPADGTFFAGFDPKEVSPISCPDNIVFDNRGNLWIGTDGMEGTLRLNDTVYACPTEGPDRGKVMPFFSVPNGAEVCGPEFTPDDTTLFVAIQHPGEGGTWSTGGRIVSNWPDNRQPVRPSVVAVVKQPGTGLPTIGS